MKNNVLGIQVVLKSKETVFWQCLYSNICKSQAFWTFLSVKNFSFMGKSFDNIGGVLNKIAASWYTAS